MAPRPEPRRTPGLSRRRREQPADEGAAPDPPTRACTAQRRTAVVVADLTHAELVAFDHHPVHVVTGSHQQRAFL